MQLGRRRFSTEDVPKSLVAFVKAALSMVKSDVLVKSSQKGDLHEVGFQYALHR